jgi:hypothetical protein
MRKVHLGLVTLFHPEVLIPSVKLNTLPRRERSRADVTQQTERLAEAKKIKITYRYQDGIVLPDSGTQLRKFANTLVVGSTLISCLSEPRLVRVPDEPNPRPKWKLEFRKYWPDEVGHLEEEFQQQFLKAMASASLCVKALWINPSLDESRRYHEWANLVLVAVKSPRAFPTAGLRFGEEDGWRYVEWAE